MFGSVRVSAPSCRLTEKYLIRSDFEGELKLIQMQQQIFLADVVARSNRVMS
jgi:hypothetical protein